MTIHKKWDTWYWVAVLIILCIWAGNNNATPDYQWTGLGVFTLLWAAIGLYLIVKAIQLTIRAIIKRRNPTV